MAEYVAFVKAVHARDMKFIMDMETQYAPSGHVWFDDSFKNPSSQYSDFIFYSDDENTKFEQLFMPRDSAPITFKAFGGFEGHIALLDLNHPKVKAWMTDFYAFWVDPNGDGNLDDGVDGFRIDHIMDDLDYKGIMTNMYVDFWKPIFDHARTINPNLFVLGEQADWNTFGVEMIEKSNADAAFGFKQLFAVMGSTGTQDMYSEADKSGTAMHPDSVHKAVQETLERFPTGGRRWVINFLDNHDTERWATASKHHPEHIRLAAVLNVLLPGIPSIYYAQELGMTGKRGDWGSDANDIPIREAFPWTGEAHTEGTAIWYEGDGTGQWWKNSIYQTGASKTLAYSAQKTDPNSLWNHYRSLIALRKNNAAFRLGDYKPVETGNAKVLAFSRSYKSNTFTVVINLSADTYALPQGLNSQVDMLSGKSADIVDGFSFVVLGD